MSLLNGSIPQVAIEPISEEGLFTTTIYTDEIAGQLKVRHYVNYDGNRVISKPDTYIGTTAIQTNKGPLTVSFEIEAKSLREAFEKWQAAALHAIQTSIGDLQSQALRRTIMTPGKGQ